MKVTRLHDYPRLKSRVTLDGFRATDAAALWEERNGLVSARVRVLGSLVSTTLPRRVKYIDFVIANFFEFHGNKLVARGSRKRPWWQRMEQCIGDYTLVVDERRYTGSLVRQLHIYAQTADTVDARTIFAVAGWEVVATLIVTGSFTPASVKSFNKSHYSAAHKIGALLATIGSKKEVWSVAPRLRKHPTTAMDPATGAQSLGGALVLDCTNAVA